MGLRDRIKSKVKRVVDTLSGEYSSAAPEEIKPYARPGVPNEDAEVVKARLKRPVDE
ncbi:MAG: hypothetical protein H6741_02695 [Alphaproteobacteria bacterium]|nr:hypothetical protein [Alphaproteobacteria bacterium]MCB9791613.1 hypothetical protein [Alphaproteobacteria bacterium]